MAMETELLLSLRILTEQQRQVLTAMADLKRVGDNVEKVADKLEDLRERLADVETRLNAIDGKGGPPRGKSELEETKL
jgi:hypothetical protein